MFYVISLKKIYKRLIFTLFIFIVLYSGISMVNKVFPVKYADLVNEFSQKYNIDPALVYAVINAESRFDPDAVSHRDARGLMQLMEGTADWGADEIGLSNYDYSKIHEPRINIELGCWYLSRHITQYNGDLVKALAAYNAGSGNVAKWLQDESYSSDGISLENIPFKETRGYIDKINIYIRAYEILLGVRNLFNF